MEDRESLDAFLEAVERNESAALATVVKTPEGAPVKTGAKMAIFADGKAQGGLGEKSLDEMAIKESLEALREGAPRSVKAALPGGGEVEVFIEVAVSLSVLLVLGAGHIAQPVAKIGKLLGFEVAVIDDRADFANKERFPEADRIIAADFVESLRSFPINDRTYIVIITRGHRYDDVCLEEVIESPAAYVGMIGSRRKVSLILEHLRKKGVPEAAIERVHAPIGLNIGAETPEEIAVSILAEIIQVRKGGKGDRMAMKACMGV